MNGYLQPMIIIDLVRRHFGLTYDEIVSEKRKREFIKAKHIAMYFCRNYTDYSLRRIGMYFSRSHCDVIHALGSVENQASVYRNYKDDLDYIETRIKDLTGNEFKRYENYNTDNV